MMTEQDDRPEGARVTTGMIGSSTGDVAVTWTERDAMLYALGVARAWARRKTNCISPPKIAAW